MLHNLPKVALKALVCQQAISLVEHKVLQVLHVLAQTCLIMLEEVSKTTGRRYDDVRDACKLVDLFEHVYAAHNH